MVRVVDVNCQGQGSPLLRYRTGLNWLISTGTTDTLHESREHGHEANQGSAPRRHMLVECT
jgi:hypothetical protein